MFGYKVKVGDLNDFIQYNKPKGLYQEIDLKISIIL